MAIAYDGILPQGATIAHSVLTTFDPCIVSMNLASMSKSKVARAKLSTAADGDENYRGSALVKYGDLTMTVIFDPDEDYNALLDDANNGTLTITLPFKDADNTTAATIVYSTAQPIGIGEAGFDYNNDTDEVTIDITWMVSGYSQTDEAL